MEMIDKLKVSEAKLSQKVKDMNSRKPKPVVKTIVKKPKTKIRTKTIVKTVTKRASKTFVATKDGKKFHEVHCPFGHNIKPKNKIVFKSKVKALNEGYKPCDCIKTK